MRLAPLNSNYQNIQINFKARLSEKCNPAPLYGDEFKEKINKSLRGIQEAIEDSPGLRQFNDPENDIILRNGDNCYTKDTLYIHLGCMMNGKKKYFKIGEVRPENRPLFMETRRWHDLITIPCYVSGVERKIRDFDETAAMIIKCTVEKDYFKKLTQSGYNWHCASSHEGSTKK